MQERDLTKITEGQVYFGKKASSINYLGDSNCDGNYHSLFEQATDAIMVTDFNGSFKDVNRSLCELFGYTKAELLELNVKTLLDPDHLQSQPLRFDLLERGENVFSERKMVHKNGTIIFVESNAKKFADNLIMVIARDITERIRVERILQKSEANLHTIFDTTDTIYVLLDNELRIISYNPRAFAFANDELGHSIEISEYFLDYFPAEKRPVLLTYMEQVLKGKHVNYEVSYPQKDSSSNWYHARLFPISKGDTDIYGLMMAVSNITEKKLHEKELLMQKVQQQKNIIRAVLKAQEVERNKIGQELHDNVNQILSSIRLNLAMIEREPRLRRDLIRKTKEYIDMAVDEIRLLSREQVTPHKTLDVKELIEGLINELNEHTQAGIRFKAEVEEQLPIDEDLKLNIYRIVQEQINNILKHAAASKATISIHQKAGVVNISILDNGKGFDPISKRKGIGISNMINRIESYNGEMVIISSPGNGCKLAIQIPF